MIGTDYYNDNTTNINTINIVLFIVRRITIIEALWGPRHLHTSPPQLLQTTP